MKLPEFELIQRKADQILGILIRFVDIRFKWYQSDNANCVNGVLVIEGRRERLPNKNYQDGSNNWKLNRRFAEYTSSSIKTQGLQEFLFGRLEIRARIDTSSGSWPAIWTLGIRGGWPLNGEVDIMEFYR